MYVRIYTYKNIFDIFACTSIYIRTKTFLEYWSHRIKVLNNLPKEPYILSKEPYIVPKEPYILIKERYILGVLESQEKQTDPARINIREFGR